MPDWSSTMQQTFEYYTVNPKTWKDVERIRNVKSCTINRDEDADSLGSVTIDVDAELGEAYVRAYLVTVQNGVKEKHPLATFLIQTPASNYDGKRRGYSMDAYTPLLELKESPPPLGYAIFKDENIMDYAYRLIRENVRAPVVKTPCDEILRNDFVANVDDTWLTFIKDLVGMADYSLALDASGRIMFAPAQDVSALQPVWTYSDDNSSILYPEISMDHDLYGIPNVVEVVYANGAGYYHARVVNDDSNSPTSTVNRGREIVYRVMDPEIGGNPTEEHVREYAERLLKTLSSIEYTVTYTHGYCPVRLGDCVRLNYARAGLNNVKARVVSQKIKCEPGCPVTEKAVYVAKLWR